MAQKVSIYEDRIARLQKNLSNSSLLNFLEIAQKGDFRIELYRTKITMAIPNSPFTDKYEDVRCQDDTRYNRLGQDP